MIFTVKTGFHLGVTSRYPLDLVHTMSAAPFHHGLLIVRVHLPAPVEFGTPSSILICVTHLNPGNNIVYKDCFFLYHLALDSYSTQRSIDCYPT
jgi:hypothetical protein